MRRYWLLRRTRSLGIFLLAGGLVAALACTLVGTWALCCPPLPAPATGMDAMCAVARAVRDPTACYMGRGYREVYPSEFGCAAQLPRRGGDELHVLFGVDTDQDYERLGPYYCFIIASLLHTTPHNVRTFIVNCVDPIGGPSSEERCAFTLPPWHGTGAPRRILAQNTHGQSRVFSSPAAVLAALRRSLAAIDPLPALFILGDEEGAILYMPAERAALAHFPLVLHNLSPRNGYTDVPDNVLLVPVGWRPGALTYLAERPPDDGEPRSTLCFFAGRRRNAARDGVFGVDRRCDIVAVGDGAPVLGAASYYARLADAQICLAPAGYDPETHRLYECLRAGAVPIIDRSQLPFLEAYLGGRAEPFFTVIDDWTPEAVGPQIDRLSDPWQLGLARHRASVAWKFMQERMPRLVRDALAVVGRGERYNRRQPE